MRFENKKAVVTGAGSGQGECIAINLAKEGADVALLDLSLDSVEKVAKQLKASKRKSIAMGVDVGDYKNSGECIKRIYKEFGQIDFLVNAAGYGKYVPFNEVTEEVWDRSIATHLKGVFNLSRHVINGMIGQRFGRIVNISSVAGIAGAPKHCHYAAAKAGVIGLTKSLAKEVAPLGVTVNAIAPGPVDTPYLDGVKVDPDRLQAILKATPVGRLGKPEEVAGLCLYLLSEEASFITGVTIIISGGYVM